MSHLSEKKMSEKLTFKTATAIGKLICPESFERMRSPEPLTVEEISAELGIHLNTVKRWIAECVFVPSMPVKALIADEFSPADDSEPIEVLAFYVFCRLAVRHLETMSPDTENAEDALQGV